MWFLLQAPEEVRLQTKAPCPQGGCQCLLSGGLSDHFHQSSSLTLPPLSLLSKGKHEPRVQGLLGGAERTASAEGQAGSPLPVDMSDLSKSICTPIPRKRTLLLITKLQKTGPASPATEPPHSEDFELQSQMLQNVFRSSYQFKNEVPA